MTRKTIQQIEDKHALSKHYTIGINAHKIAQSNEDIYEIEDTLNELLPYLIIEPDEWADHDYIDLD
ncbi:hypothetical protein QI260_05945 [Staphylococcus saprophyticus]|nr:hypothetical protein [Staphylococcus saprophyticus]